MLSYILGFLSHYTLDSQCHAYINTKSKVSGISHNKVESEYDGHMMRLDGRAVNDVDRADSLRPNAHIAAVMAEFFPFTGKDLLRTTKMQRFIISALTTLISCVASSSNYCQFRFIPIPVRECLILPTL